LIEKHFSNMIDSNCVQLTCNTIIITLDELCNIDLDIALLPISNNLLNISVDNKIHIILHKQYSSYIHGKVKYFQNLFLKFENQFEWVTYAVYHREYYRVLPCHIHLHQWSSISSQQCHPVKQNQRMNKWIFISVLLYNV
jgi:hypothetical protein